MTNRSQRRRYRKAQDRRVWVFSELNHDLTPHHLARVLAAAALEQVQRERDAEPERDAAAESPETPS